jgi:hypothetical protein
MFVGLEVPFPENGLHMTRDGGFALITGESKGNAQAPDMAARR